MSFDSVRIVLLVSCLVLAAALVGGAQAQGSDGTTFRIVVIVSDAGANADRGALERRVAEAWSARQRGRGGIFGRPVTVEVRSDGGSIEGAVRAAEIAIGLDAHAIVCCSAPAASRRVAELALSSEVPLLAPTGTPDPPTEGWAHALAADDAAELQATVRDVYARGGRALALMTLEGSFGDSVRATLDGFLAAPDLDVVSDVRHPAAADVLTPEALRTAVTLPDAVIVWGLRDDSLRALEGLRARGWTGPVYLRPAILAAAAGGATLAAGGDVRVMVSPASAPSAAQTGDDAAAWLFEARALGAGALESRTLRADGARMHDALTLLALAFEQLSTYGIDVAEVRTVRSALRDALIGLPPTTLAAGRYDLAFDDASAARADGLIAVRLGGGRLLPLD